VVASDIWISLAGRSERSQSSGRLKEIATYEGIRVAGANELVQEEWA